MGMNIYTLLDLKKKKNWKKKWKWKIKGIEKQTSSFGILKTKKNGKIGEKQKKYLGQT